MVQSDTKQQDALCAGKLASCDPHVVVPVQQSVIINHLSAHLPSAQALIDRYNLLSQPQEDATPSVTSSSTPLAPPSSSSARPARRLSRRRPITQQFSREPPTRSSLAPLLRQVQVCPCLSKRICICICMGMLTLLTLLTCVCGLDDVLAAA